MIKNALQALWATARTPILMLWVVGLGGCILTASEAPPTRPMHIEALVDVSGSYQLRAEAVATLKAGVAQMKGGDRLRVRSLASVSHREGGILLDTIIPVTGPVPARMDVRAVDAHQKAEDRAAAVRVFILERLDEIQAMPASGHTDIVGGMVVATEALEHDAPERSGLLLAFTDGKDNGPNKDARFALDMSGIDVVFAHFDPSGTLEERMGLKNSWTERIAGDWRAASLEFLPAATPLDLDRYRKTPPDMEGTSR